VFEQSDKDTNYLLEMNGMTFVSVDYKLGRIAFQENDVVTNSMACGFDSCTKVLAKIQAIDVVAQVLADIVNNL
jgi:hypothetical protein